MTRALPIPLLLAVWMCTALLAAAPPAFAQQHDPAAAEQLFQEARALMKDEQYEEACPKFAESHRLDPGTGVLLFLGDCYLKIGKTASAWAAYQEALPRARSEGRAERIEAAERGIAATTPRLVKLRVEVASEHRVAGLAVERDGLLLTKAAWGSEVPVDPGEHVVKATAPGYQSWSTTVTLQEGDPPATVEVPALSAEAPSPGPTSAPAPVPVAPPSPDPTPPASGGMSSMRLAGFVVGGVGVAGLVAAAVTGGLVLAKRGILDDHCDDQKRCDAEGLDAASSAKTLAIANTVAWGVGIVGVGVGIALVLFGGDDGEQSELTVLPLAGPEHAGLALIGSF